MIPMINLPCNAASMSQVTPCQNVPVQTSQYNFPTCQQRQTNTQQMQTTACGPCSGTSQGPCTHVYQPDTYIVSHQCAPGAPQLITNPCHPVFQSPCNPPRIYPSCSQLPQNILEQIRACVSNTAPIFILPSSCQQSPPQQQQQPSAPTVPQAMTSSAPTAATYPPNALTYPAAYYPPPPPPFYPYPIPMPFGDPFIRARETAQNCGCYRKRDTDPTDIRSVARAVCRYDVEPEEHYCTPTTDDTICSRRNCPSSLHLQALASQFLSMQGIIPCAATRLVLRKVPGSNVTTTMEDTMTRAQKAISVLTKDQLLSESRNAQQVNALINLHMTANPPPNIIPILTLMQLKMNLLKAQVEGLVNQKLMEIQGVGVEVETELIDPTVLALKSDAELRDFLSALRQKECDERVNVNFAPYRSQRAIAETRLSNVQNKIRQVEAEFDRRRCAMLPAPTLSSRVVQQFTRPCYSARFEDPRKLYSTLPPDSFRSPDPFTCVKPRSPKRLLLKPHTSKPEATTQAGAAPQSSTRQNPTSDVPKTTGDDGAGRAKQNPATPDQQRSTENCTCDRTTSEESVSEAKKKLRARIIEIDATSNVEAREASSLVKLIPNVCVRMNTEKRRADERKCDERDETRSREMPCDMKCWIGEAYINVADDVSVKTLTESESVTITLCEKIDAQDVCKSRGVIEIQSHDQIMDRREFGSSANSRQFEKQTDAEIAISRKDEAIKEYDIESKSLQGSATSKVEQEEMKATTVAEVADDDPISSAQETERKSPDGKYISSLEITLKPKEERRKEEQKDKNGVISSLSTDKTREHESADKVPISKSEKKIRFHIVSMIRDIVYDKNLEYRMKRKIDKIIATSGTKINLTTNPDIEKSDKYSSIENILRSAIAHDNAGKDRSENMFPKRMDLLKLDRQCQTLFEAIEEDKQASVALLRANIFPPFKNLRKYVRNNEKNGDDVGIYPSPIRKAGITPAKRLSRCNNVTENTLKTAYNAPYHSNLEDEESFVSEIFSIISSRVVSFLKKIIMLNKRLLYPNSSAILRGSLNIDAFRKDAPIRYHSGLNSKDYDPSASILHYPLGSNQGTSRSSKHNFRDTSLLRVSKGEGYARIREIRHSIIEDGENGTKYLLINTSDHNRDSISTRNLGRPYEVQKSLLIRSRLKSSLNSQDHPYPFSLLKRTERNAHESHRIKHNENTEMIAERKIRELKRNKKFWTLTAVTKASKNNGKLSEMRKCDDEFKERISHEYSYDDITHNNVSTVEKSTVIRNTAASNELVINVHDYLGLQTEINARMHENRSAHLLLSNN
nr:PREDICTED: uncharacterized protein LOC105678129 isoform X1 [Linepithema humile]